MIDIRTGHITIDTNLTINKNSDFESVRKMKLGEIQQVDDMGNDWIWIRIKNIVISGYFFNFSFGFNKNRIKELYFAMSDSRFDINSDWSESSEKKELGKLEFYNDWLKKEIGSQRLFDWGQVWADYDRKGGFSSIGLRYNDNN
jgi:hypothetical protein